jgi:inosose dehydratase
MKKHSASTRRQFLHHTAFSTAALACAVPGTPVLAGEPFGGLKMGVASYSLRKFTLDQAIAMTRDLGVKGITLKDMHLPMKSTPEQRKEAAKKIRDAGLELLGVGVIYMKKEQEADIPGIFTYAQDAGAPTIVCSPDLEVLDTVEKLAKQTGIRIAIHNHGPGDKKYPSPLDALKLVKDRHELMGLCMDVGHTVRIGQNPVEVMNACASRLYDFHMKDVTEATAKGKGTIAGKGVIDVPAVLKALVNLKFKYHVALEYEIDEKDPLPGMKASFDYMRQVLA